MGKIPHKKVMRINGNKSNSENQRRKTLAGKNQILNVSLHGMKTPNGKNNSRPALQPINSAAMITQIVEVIQSITNGINITVTQKNKRFIKKSFILLFNNLNPLVVHQYMNLIRTIEQFKCKKQSIHSINNI